MPYCNVSDLVLVVEVGDCADDLSPLESSEDARAVLDLLVERGCSMGVEEERGCCGDGSPRAEFSKVGCVVRFYNFLANTNQVADRLGVEASHVVKSIDVGLLTGVRSPNGFYRLVVKDGKHDSITADEAREARPLGSRRKKVKGRGLKEMIQKAIGQGLVNHSSFGVDGVQNALARLGWRLGRNYADTSVLSSLKNLELEGVVKFEKNGVVRDRRWSVVRSGVTAPQAATALSPSSVSVGSNMDEMIEELSDAVAARVRQRAMEKLGL